MSHAVLNITSHQVYLPVQQYSLNDLEQCAKELTDSTGKPFVVKPLCEHCNENLARVIDDIRGHPIKLCLPCWKLLDKNPYLQ